MGSRQADNCERVLQSPSWRQSCTCPGAEAIRGIRDQLEAQPVDFSDFRAGWAKYRQESKSRREAFKAAQASAAGLDREQLKDQYVAELRSPGLDHARTVRFSTWP